jgi:hypothetical protein
VGFDAKGVAPSTLSHYEHNTRKLHDSPPDKPLAIIIPGTSLTIAKGLNKIIDKERATALKEGNRNYKAFIPTMMDLSVPAPKEILRPGVLIQLGQRPVRLRQTLLSRSDFVIQRETTVEISANRPKSGALPSRTWTARSKGQ